MNFIVCIKQVPGTTEVKIDPRTNTLIREGVESIVNPFDTYAIEEGLRLKERMGGKVTVISMGPPQAESALREALSMGCDEAVLFTDPAFAGSDTLATSYTIACGIRKIGEFDLVICGKQAIDGDTAQVGPGIAEKLGIPAVTYVKKIEEIDEAHMRVERMMEEGYEVIEMGRPALITVVKEINEPRLPSLRGMMRARKAKIDIWNASDMGCETSRIGQPGSPTIVNRIFTPPPRKGGELILGDPEEQSQKLVEKLRETKVI